MCYIYFINHTGIMPFYGYKQNYQSQILELEQQLQTMMARNATTNYSDIKLPKQINLNTIGNTILQSIFSAKYVFNCIEEYFQREWIQPANHYLHPHIRTYQSIPVTLTKLKENYLSGLTTTHRILVTNFLSMCVFAAGLKFTPQRVLLSTRNSLLTFVFSSWLLLPEIGQKYVTWLGQIL